MFYICGLYDRGTCLHLNKVVIANRQTRYNVRDGYLTCMFEDANNLIAGVFDSTDGSVEWYSVFDLLKILESSGVEIRGISLDYFANSLRRNLARPTNIDSLKEYTLTVSLANATSGFRTSVAKLKMQGINITEDGVLNEFNNCFCKDGVVSFPDEIYRLSSSAFYNYGNTSIPAYMFLVGKNFNMNDVYRVAQRLNYGDKNVVVFNENVHIKVDFFSAVKCNIYSRGTLTYGNFKGLLERLKSGCNSGRYWGYKYINGRRFYLADESKIVNLDFSDYTVTVSENNGRIKY